MWHKVRVGVRVTKLKDVVLWLVSIVAGFYWYWYWYLVSILGQWVELARQAASRQQQQLAKHCESMELPVGVPWPPRKVLRH